MSLMKYLALFRDSAPSADGCSHPLGIYETLAEANEAVRDDMRRYRVALADMRTEVEVNGALVSVVAVGDERLCEWETVRLPEEDSI